VIRRVHGRPCCGVPGSASAGLGAPRSNRLVELLRHCSGIRRAGDPAARQHRLHGRSDDRRVAVVGSTDHAVAVAVAPVFLIVYLVHRLRSPQPRVNFDTGALRAGRRVVPFSEVTWARLDLVDRPRTHNRMLNRRLGAEGGHGHPFACGPERANAHHCGDRRSRGGDARLPHCGTAHCERPRGRVHSLQLARFAEQGGRPRRSALAAFHKSALAGGDGLKQLALACRSPERSRAARGFVPRYRGLCCVRRIMFADRKSKKFSGC